MPRKGENIYKRKDGRWEGRYLKRTPDGKSRYGYVYAPTYREAKIRLQKAAALWEAGVVQEKQDALLLSSAAENWLRSLDGQVKESTYVKYRTILTNHLIPALGDVSVEEMTHQKLEAFSNSLLRSQTKWGRPLAPRTVSDIMGILRSILRHAMRNGARVPCDGSSIQVRRAKSEIRVFTRREQEILCQYIFNNMSLRNLGVLLSLFAGLRVGEICALRWEDIALEERLLHVRHTMQRIQTLAPEGPRTHVVITAPKTATSIRTIPLPEELAQLMETCPGNTRGFFLTGREDAYLEPRVMQYHFRGMLEKCGVEKANFHALRHTFATRCVELGFDVKSLSELLGHSTVTMTMDRYVHPTMEHKREHMQRLRHLMEPAGKDGEDDG